MRTSLRLLPAILALLLASSVLGVVSAQTPDVERANPCADAGAATPVDVGTPASGVVEQPPEIDPDQAILGALTIHQENIVTTLDVMVATGDDADLVSFASDELAEAREMLVTLRSFSGGDATDHPAAMVAVLDELRQQRDLPADQGGLDAYRPGSVLDTLCREDIDRDAVAIQTLVANDTAIVEIAALGVLVVDSDAIEVLDAVAAAANDRLDWLDARAAASPIATPVATPQP